MGFEFRNADFRNCLKASGQGADLQSLPDLPRYGPIAALLVELFPTRIRYTSMSLPYHIGNGWFGGFLPTIAFAMVVVSGNIYQGLWYPIVIATMSLVIGTLFLPETKDVDIRK